MQSLFNLRHCFEGSIKPKETVLVPELVAAAAGSGLPVLRGDEDSHRARMVIHVGASRISGGVFVDGGLTDWIVVRNRLALIGSRNKRLVGECLDRLGLRLGFRATEGFCERARSKVSTADITRRPATK